MYYKLLLAIAFFLLLTVIIRLFQKGKKDKHSPKRPPETKKNDACSPPPDFDLVGEVSKFMNRQRAYIQSIKI